MKDRNHKLVLGVKEERKFWMEKTANFVACVCFLLQFLGLVCLGFMGCECWWVVGHSCHVSMDD